MKPGDEDVAEVSPEVSPEVQWLKERVKGNRGVDDPIFAFARTFPQLTKKAYRLEQDDMGDFDSETFFSTAIRKFNNLRKRSKDPERFAKNLKSYAKKLEDEMDEIMALHTSGGDSDLAQSVKDALAKAQAQAEAPAEEERPKAKSQWSPQMGTSPLDPKNNIMGYTGDGDEEGDEEISDTEDTGDDEFSPNADDTVALTTFTGKFPKLKRQAKKLYQALKDKKIDPYEVFVDLFTIDNPQEAQKQIEDELSKLQGKEVDQPPQESLGDEDEYDFDNYLDPDELDRDWNMRKEGFQHKLSNLKKKLLS